MAAIMAASWRKIAARNGVWRGMAWRGIFRGHQRRQWRIMASAYRVSVAAWRRSSRQASAAAARQRQLASARHGGSIQRIMA